MVQQKRKGSPASAPASKKQKDAPSSVTMRLSELSAVDNGLDGDQAVESLESPSTTPAPLYNTNPYAQPVEDDGGIDEDDEELRVYLESKQKKFLKPSINNQGGLSAKLREIQQTNILPWPETFLISAQEPLDCQDVNDDIQREAAFYNQALKAAEIGLELCEEYDIKHMRPMDYYAEMMKTDAHMYKVRQQLALDKKQVEIKEQRRMQKDMLKFGKMLQQEKKKRNKEGKEDKKVASKKSGRKNKLDEDDDDFAALEAEAGGDDEEDNRPRDRTGRVKQVDKHGKFLKSAKRRVKDARYGAMGKKKGSKYNTRESFLSGERLGALRPKLHNSKRQGRPGKAVRAQSKSKSRRK